MSRLLHWPQLGQLTSAPCDISWAHSCIVVSLGLTASLISLVVGWISAVVVEVTGPRGMGWGNSTINTTASWWEKMQSCIQRHVDTERGRPCGHSAACPIEQGSYRKRARTLSWPDSEKHQGKVPWPQNTIFRALNWSTNWLWGLELTGKKKIRTVSARLSFIVFRVWGCRLTLAVSTCRMSKSDMRQR